MLVILFFFWITLSKHCTVPISEYIFEHRTPSHSYTGSMSYDINQVERKSISCSKYNQIKLSQPDTICAGISQQEDNSNI